MKKLWRPRRSAFDQVGTWLYFCAEMAVVRRQGVYLRILIISRKAEEVRRNFQIRQMAAHGLSFEFLDAFEAADLTAEECQTAASNWPSPTRRQDIGCFLSHRKAWQAVVEHGAKMLILEDDLQWDVLRFVMGGLRLRNGETEMFVAANL